MSQYNSSNVKLSNSQLNKLNSWIKNETEVVLRLPSNMMMRCDSNDETNYLHELLLTTGKVANLRKAVANSLPADIKLPKLFKMI